MVQAYTMLNGSLRQGIALADDGTITVGEEGRGRTLVRVPLPQGSEVRDGVVYQIPVSDPHVVAVVLIRDHSGFRGGWRLTAARSEEEWDLIVRRDTAHRPPDGKGALAPGHQLEMLGACPACAAIGRVPPVRPADVQVIAQGFAAQGIAGRMGGGPEYLLALRPGDAIELVRSGRLYGEPAVLRLAVGSDGKPMVSDPRAEAWSRAAAARW